jgi:hypothetical protein
MNAPTTPTPPVPDHVQRLRQRRDELLAAQAEHARIVGQKAVDLSKRPTNPKPLAGIWWRVTEMLKIDQALKEVNAELRASGYYAHPGPRVSGGLGLGRTLHERQYRRTRPDHRLVPRP